MRRISPLQTTALLFLAILFAVPTAEAYSGDDDYDDYDVTARVLRVTLVQGDASLKRYGGSSWERAVINLPLVEGDTLATGNDGKIEIQIDQRNFIRIGERSVLQVVSLRDEGIAFSLSEGTATARLARFDREKEYFEIDGPRTTLSAERKGVYRFDVLSEDRVRMTVRGDGRARIYSPNSGFVLKDDRSAEFIYAGEDDWSFFPASRDGWDAWVEDRERYVAARWKFDQRDRYYDSYVWGAEDLDAYGDWTFHSSYGWLWRPQVNVINVYSNWAPYRYGHWRWCHPYGWTWIADEPWGWAPYHYGRWVIYNDVWCWAPRGYGYEYRRSWWRPALVAFVYIPSSYGERIAWYPLTYGQRDPHSRFFQQRGRLDPLRSDEAARLIRTNPAYLRAVTTLPAREFGRQTARLEQASDEIARRAVTGEPVRGRLPVLPADGDRAGSGTSGNRTRATARPPAFISNPAVVERPTGAGTRVPGAPLDPDLRRTRVFNNRTPLPVDAGQGSPAGGGGVRTGIVARPARPGGTSSNASGSQSGTGGSGEPRPLRPVRGVNPNDGNAGEIPGRILQPARPDRGSVRTTPPATGGSAGSNQPSVPSPARPQQPARPARPDGNREGTRPPWFNRNDNPQPQPAPVPRRVDSPPPQRTAPPPRNDSPPPQRTAPPPPRNDAPARPTRSPADRPARNGRPEQEIP